MMMKKVVKLGKADGFVSMNIGGEIKHGKLLCSVYCFIEYDGERLSITGVVGPMANGNSHGSVGQIVGEPIVEYAEGWDAEKVDQFYKIWHRWHLNDLRPGCEHQRKMGWDKMPIDPSKPLEAYGKFYEGQKSATWNMWAWISVHEHEKGLLDAKCPVCSYRYGTSWFTEAVPQEVLDFLAGLPESDTLPPERWLPKERGK